MTKPKAKPGAPVGNRNAVGKGAKKVGNKNALKHGRYEAIMLETLDPTERELFDLARAQPTLESLQKQIGLTEVRLRRMMRRIADLKAIEPGLSVVETNTESLELGADEQREISDKILSQLDPDDVDALTGSGEKAVSIQKVKEKRTGTLGQIQAIEAEVTNVQAGLRQLLRLKHDMEVAGNGGQGPGGRGADGVPDDVARALLKVAVQVSQGR